jgi:hypothetical protein
MPFFMGRGDDFLISYRATRRHDGRGAGCRNRTQAKGMSLGLLKFSGGSVDDYAICRSS